METKQCITCGTTQSLEQFYKRSDGTNGGYTGECKTCRKVRASRHYVENTVRHKALVRHRYETFGRFARYGLSLADYDAMLERQGGTCKLCKSAKPGGKGKWHIDHIGGTNPKVFNQCKSDSVRGLLCHRCNVSLGHYEKLLGRVGKDAVLAYLHLKE